MYLQGPIISQRQIYELKNNSQIYIFALLKKLNLTNVTRPGCINYQELWNMHVIKWKILPKKGLTVPLAPGIRFMRQNIKKQAWWT
jgi:hypothetical protein